MKRNLPIRTLLLTGVCLSWFAPAFAQESLAADIDIAPPTVNNPAADEYEEESRQQTVVVRGLFIPDEKRNTSEVASLIDAGDFQLQGDSNAASALSRVAGISTADAKFIYVRGLNERYSSALLNGSPLPSPSPLRRVAPLDLFPTSALKSVLVQKTYSPNLPAEFAGGTVDLRTKAVPDDRFLSIGFSTAYDSEATWEEGLMYDGGDSDWLGFDDGARDLPSLENGLNGTFGTELTDNPSLLVMQQGEIAPNFGVDLTAGERFDLSQDITMGLLGALSYSNSWSKKQGKRGYAFSQTDGLGTFYDLDRASTENNIGINSLITAGFDLYSDHEVKFIGLMSRSTDKEARQITGTNEEDVNIREDSLEWFERELWSTQAQGEHFLPSMLDLKVEWRGSYSEAKREAPYQLSNIYIFGDDGVPALSSSSAANRFQFSEVYDNTTDFGVDLQLPLSRSGDCTFFCEVDVKAGYAYLKNNRKADNFIYDVNGVGATNGDLRIDTTYAFLAATNQLSISEIAGEQFPQRYIASLESDAGYLGLDAQVTPHIRAAIGARYESALQAVDTRVIGGDLSTNLIEAVIKENDWLPAATITWNPIEDLQVRAGYSQTITRPQFRELAPAVFVNTETNSTFFGNPFLVNASIKNYDLRGEYYFSRDQFITFGLFYKDLLNPIEEILVPAETLQTTFINAPSAKLFGYEVEYEQSLPLFDWTKSDFFLDREVLIKANYTWTDAEVSSEGDVAFNIGTNLNPVRGTTAAAGRIEDGRPLQGQSEHLINLQVGLLNEATHSDMNLLINYVSERIRSGEVLARSLPAILEQPPITVDFVWNKSIDLDSGEVELSLNIENLLGEGYEAYQERNLDKVLVDTYDKGTVVSFGLKRKF
ncbi:MAG: TonB-dependent receptor domain-containing protein [Hyphomonas sp.]